MYKFHLLLGGLISLLLLFAASDARAAELAVKKDGSGNFTTIQACANAAQAGDTCVVFAGTYNERIFTTRSGTPGAPIIFRANAQDRVIIDGENIRDNGIRVQASYIQIKGFEFTRALGSCILIGWAPDITGIDVIENDVYSCGNTTDSAAVYYTSHTGSITDNHLHDNAGDGITLNSADNVLIHGNNIHDNQVDGIKGGGPGTVIIENNIIHDMTNTANHGDCMQLMGNTGTLIVRNNLVGDCTQDIYTDDYSSPEGIAPWGDTYIYNNVVYNSNPGASGLDGFWNGIIAGVRYNHHNSYNIFNNTLINMNNGGGGLSMGNAGTFPQFRTKVARVFNNIFYNSINSVNPTYIDNLSMDYNLYYNQYRNWVFGDGWRSFENYRTAHPEFEQHGSYSNSISFIKNSFPNPDFHLAAGSAAINAGTAISPIGSISFNSDIDGNSRPQGAAWDVGAYEYLSGGSPVPIIGDINLDHIVNAIDYSILNSDWFTSNSRSDLNTDGLVNAIDYSMLNANWFRTW